MSPLLFAVSVTAFVSLLYTAEHLVTTRWSALAPRDRERRSDTHGQKRA